MSLFHAGGAKRFRNVKMKIALLAAGAAILGSSLMGCAKSGAPTPQETHQLQPPDRAVVLQEEKQVQKSESVREHVFVAAEEILKGQQLLGQAQESLKNSIYFLAAEQDLSQALTHFLKAEENGVDVSHYIKQIKQLYQQLVQADFELLREGIEHKIQSGYWQDALYAIKEFEKQLVRLQAFVNRGFYEKEIEILRGKVHTAYVEHQFAFARQLLQKATSPAQLPQVTMEVKDALQFIEKSKSQDFGLDIGKIEGEGRQIIGSTYLKDAEFKVASFKAHQKINIGFAIKELEDAKKLAQKAAEYGVNAGPVLGEIEKTLVEVTGKP